MLYYIKKRTDSLLRLTAIKTKIGGLIMKNEIKKTVVPQFVAEWFEENKWDLEYEIYNVITEIFSKDSSEYSKIEQWFDSNFWNGKNNYPIETVVRMQDGYTIEKDETEEE